MNYKIWYAHQLGAGEAFERVVSSPEEGEKILDAIYDVMLHLFDNFMIPDYANTGGVLYLDDDGEWVDFHPEDFA